MSKYTITTTINQPYDDAVAAVREALGEAIGRRVRDI